MKDFQKVNEIRILRQKMGGFNMKCTCCGKECYNDNYPEIVFNDGKNIICEECSMII